MSGIFHTGSKALVAVPPVSGAQGRQRSYEECMRARRAACHRSVVDVALTTVLESQATSSGVTHRHFEGRRQSVEAREMSDAGSRAARPCTDDKQDADIAPASVESRLSSTSAAIAGRFGEDLPSSVIIPTAPNVDTAPIGQSVERVSIVARVWRRLVALLGAVISAPQAPPASSSPEATNVLRKQHISTLGFREFTLPQRKPVVKPSLRDEAQP